MIKLYICCLVLIIGSVEVGPDIDMKFHQEVMEIVSYDINKSIDQFTDVFGFLLLIPAVSSRVKVGVLAHVDCVDWHPDRYILHLDRYMI